MLKRNL